MDVRAELHALRERLNDLTIDDAHRLGRRLERLRGTRGTRPLARFADEVAAAEERIAKRRAAVPERIDYPAELPVSARREDLLRTIRDHQVVVVAGETGSGKSTQLPKLCLELGRGVRGTIAHTQPRRLAARTIAERVAEELRVPLGGAVGYAVRFADRSSETTLVRLMTDGLLLAEIQHDRLLRRYDTIVVDEAHERSLNIDFLLGVLKRILPQRPELKLLITSATIDPERLSAHFDGAPVVEVSGRTYPVEVRYRPVPDAEHERLDAIPDAVKELLRDGPGDVLVFLSGEREIRDAAELLSGRLRGDVEILPLYARLSHAEQQKVFQQHARRRVVLATNVAETSLTVPGVGAVVDPGTARVSRYSARLKVQRLPIEPISQASAQQRNGRCGRTSDGICIRLYDEDDFAARPRFTDPEILRTSLASVILQMAALELGDVEEFPFLDPPDARQVRDGVALLRELGALEPASERRREKPPHAARPQARAAAGRPALRADGAGGGPARLRGGGDRDRRRPVDPGPARVARRGAAGRRGAARALRRPDDDRRRRSDFLAFLRAVALRARAAESAERIAVPQALQGRVPALPAHPRVAGPRRPAAPGGEGDRRQDKPSASRAGPDPPRAARRAAVARRRARRDAGGRDRVRARRADADRSSSTRARAARASSLSPGSGLARRPPDWAMVAELVETTRLWGHTAARIDPAWIEPVAPAHLLRHAYGEPRWDARRGAAMVDERVTLYGLPIVPARAGPVRARGPGRRARAVPAARARRRRVGGATRRSSPRTRGGSPRSRRWRTARAAATCSPARRRAFASSRTACRPTSSRRSSSSAGGATPARAQPELLTLPRELLRTSEADLAEAPTEWRDGELSLPLSYKFEPGAADDGVTVHVPLERVGELRADEFTWLVPALREELVTALIRSLPKELRRSLVPVPQVAAQLLARLRPGREPLLDALSRELERLGVRGPARGVGRRAGCRRTCACASASRTGGGEVVAEGEDLDALREAVKPRLREQLAAATPSIERGGARAWEFDTLPRELAPAAGGGLRAYPALVDEGETVGVRLLETPAGAGRRDARRHAPAAAADGPLADPVGRRPARHRRQARADDGAARQRRRRARRRADRGARRADRLRRRAGVGRGGVGATARPRRRLARGRDARDRSRARRGAGGAPRGRAAARRAAGGGAAAGDPPRRRAPARTARPPWLRRGRRRARLPDVQRYLQAAAARLDRLPDAAGSDRDRMRTIHELEAAYEGRLADWPAGTPRPPSLYEVRWMLEELRVAQFAPALGARVTAKQVRRAIARPG